MKVFIKMVHDLDNVLIIFDESHIANKYGQTLYSLYNILGFFNIKRLYSKNIKIVHFTATPDSLLGHVDIWKNSLKVIRMQVPENYISVETYFERGQIFECKPLIGYHDNIRALLVHMDLDDPFTILYELSWAKHHDLIQDFRSVFSSFDFQYISEPSYRKNGEFYSLLYSKPNKHTFIFIIDKLRCAKSIPLNFLQICYDRFVEQPSSDSVAQGLLGRCTGYHSTTSSLAFSHSDIYFINMMHLSNITFYILFKLTILLAAGRDTFFYGTNTLFHKIDFNYEKDIFKHVMNKISLEVFISQWLPIQIKNKILFYLLKTPHSKGEEAHIHFFRFGEKTYNTHSGQTVERFLPFRNEEFKRNFSNPITTIYKNLPIPESRNDFLNFKKSMKSYVSEMDSIRIKNNNYACKS